MEIGGQYSELQRLVAALHFLLSPSLAAVYRVSWKFRHLTDVSKESGNCPKVVKMLGDCQKNFVRGYCLLLTLCVEHHQFFSA